MIDVEDTLRAELELLVPAPGLPDWSQVLELAGHRRASASRRWVTAIGLFTAAAAVLVAVAVATPLGAAIAHGFGGFSAWISGEPGSPAPRAQRQAFARANARSWLGFPAGTQLRLLRTVTQPATGRAVQLLGFRSGSTLCIRIAVLGKTLATTQSCAPLADLRLAGAPVRVVLVDQGFGKGTKQAWYGIDRLGSSAVQVTAGIAADGVKKVILQDNTGRHTLRAAANAFLYVAWEPDVGQRVNRIWARTAKGLVSVPFAPAPFGFGGGGVSQQTATGPTHVQRHVSGGTIGWLDHSEPRGQPLNVLPRRTATFVRRHAVFGRVIAPDPNTPIRLAITLSTSHKGGKATGICTWLITSSNGAGGGCAVRAELFSQDPITTGTSLAGGSDEFATISGLASDEVAKVLAFLANGQPQSVPLADNAYVVQIARSKFPVRLVAYDSGGRIIGIAPTLQDMGGGGSPAPARGRARLLLQVTSPTGATAKLYVGKSTSGGNCMYVRWYQNTHAGGEMIGCTEAIWRGSPIQLGGGGPTGIWEGQVRQDVSTVELRFADGTHATTKPTDGYILYATPRNHLAPGHEPVEAIARNSAGKMIGTESFNRPKQ
jgi:hypothetical protein